MANYPAAGWPTTGRIPPTVHWSALCWIAASVVYVVGAVVATVLTFQRLAELRPGSLGRPGVEEAFTTGFIVGATVALVVILALAVMMVLFAFKMRAGRQWARITLTVLGGVFILFNLPSAFGAGFLRLNGQNVDTGATAVVGTVSAAITLLLLIAAVILQWLPAGRAHFATPYAAPPPWPPPPGYPWQAAPQWPAPGQPAGQWPPGAPGGQWSPGTPGAPGQPGPAGSPWQPPASSSGPPSGTPYGPPPA